MSFLTVGYILFIMAGLVWLVYKVNAYRERERAREAQLNQASIYDEQFKAYLKTLTKSKPGEEKKGAAENLSKDKLT